jgi:hypothetical protein
LLTLGDPLAWKSNPSFLFSVMLDPLVFKKLDLVWCPHQVDCFAAMNNSQLEHYVSWLPDPFALHADFLSEEAPEGLLYAFPPFSRVLSTLSKMIRESRKATVVVPFWPARPFRPVLLSLLTDWPMLLPLKAMSLPRGIFDPEVQVPEIQLLACSISGRQQERRAFQEMRGSTACEPTSATAQASLRRFRSMNDLFASRRTTELLGLITLPYTPSRAS